jgi:hypothetical protein
MLRSGQPELLHVDAGSGRSDGFAVRDIALAEEIVRQSALSLDAARLFRSRLDAVAADGAGLCPPQPEVPDRFSCSVSRSAAEEARGTSGYYDVAGIDADLNTRYLQD